MEIVKIRLGEVAAARGTYLPRARKNLLGGTDGHRFAPGVMTFSGSSFRAFGLKSRICSLPKFQGCQTPPASLRRPSRMTGSVPQNGHVGIVLAATVWISSVTAASWAHGGEGGEEFQGPSSRFEPIDRGAGGFDVTVMKRHRLTTVFQKVPEGYIGFVEELPGANTQGRTLAEARRSLSEAIEMVREANRMGITLRVRLDPAMRNPRGDAPDASLSGSKRRGPAPPPLRRRGPRSRPSHSTFAPLRPRRRRRGALQGGGVNKPCGPAET